jgi:uncharacterized protein
VATTNEFPSPRGFAAPLAVADQVHAFLRDVHGWMCLGLAITALTAWFVAASPAIVYAIATNRLLFWLVIGAQFGIVILLSARVARLAASTASLLFVAYSALTGVTMSFVLLAYTGESVAAAFLVSAGMFAGLVAFGTMTRYDLQGFGQFLFMGLIGIVLASVVGIFWHSDGLQFVISFIGVIVFAGLATYDAQRLKQMALASPERPGGSYAIAGALSMYLDFINLFLSLLRLFGGRRQD